ncbi:MAG: hypothetical protein Q9178_005434 [Gyalolechia marmorata]
MIGLISIVLAGPTAALDSTSVVPPSRFPHGVLEARYDNEPGDEIKRTMCFCTSDPTLEQVDIDPFEFHNVSALHQMGYVYQFEYYNHRIDKRFLLTANETCYTKPGREDYYWHNACLKWTDQRREFCARYYNVDVSPVGLKNKGSEDYWEFCYYVRGDTFGEREIHEPDLRDHFEFETGSRALPRLRDWVADAGVVEAKCDELCEETLGMDLFRTKRGGYFNRMESFHHFDDICDGNAMDCGALTGP